MKKIEIKISEKDKLGKYLTLLNFRDELVNFMYKKTIADSSRTSMRFFVLIFFLSLKVDSKSLLMSLFEENIEKIINLNKAFSGREKLRAGEYAELIKNNGLEQIFKYDIFFILITTVLDSDRILSKFSKYFSENTEVAEEFIKVIEKYGEVLADFDMDFKTHLIADDRIDDTGESHDLSKSVYRTIKMRTSRSIDLELHKYAELRVVKSESPIDLTIIQHIDPQIIIDLWNTYNLGDYVKVIWHGIGNVVVAYEFKQILADKWLKWKVIDGKKNRKEKLKAKTEFDVAKNDPEQNIKLMQLVGVLAESVIKSNEHLQNEIRVLKEKKKTVAREKILIGKDKKIKELEERIEKLENIEVLASEIRAK
jgi:hypothetical protein